MSKQRQNVNVELADGSKMQLERVRRRNGMTQKELMSRLINWFCTQTEITQQAVLGQIPREIAPDVAKMVLERLAAGTLSLDAIDGDSAGDTGTGGAALMGEFGGEADGDSNGHRAESTDSASESETAPKRIMARPRPKTSPNEST